MKKKAHTNAGNPNSKLNDNSKESQRLRLLEALNKAPVSTYDARHKLNIMSPAARMFELRHDYLKNIVTHRRTKISPEGHTHNVAEYVLLTGKWKGNYHAK